jgi:hypothetical protein
MKVLFTSLDLYYAGKDLGVAFSDCLPEIKETATSFEAKEDNRTLVVVLMCPCCAKDRTNNINTPGAILVSPFRGIDPHGYKIECADRFPPYRNPGTGEEALTDDDFLLSFLVAIERALE